METIDEVNNERDEALIHWLHVDCGVSNLSLFPLEGAASFRRYFRLHTDQTSFIVMDAPPQFENCQSYMAVANALRKMQLHTPDIIAADVVQGFLLITDFGDTTYLKGLNTKNADHFYHKALSALAILQNCQSVPGHNIPFFTHDLMWNEWKWHKEWFLNKLLKLKLGDQEPILDECFLQLISVAMTQPQVFMHRDFHSGNLMMLPHDEVGILDFQDAFIGPVTYDLVSLLRDCYIDWPEEWIKRWVNQYKTLLQEYNLVRDISESVFMQWVDWMGIERHLKALFTFARKCLRDQATAYLNPIPRTLNYLITVSERYPSLAPLHSYFREVVKPAFSKVDAICVQ